MKYIFFALLPFLSITSFGQVDPGCFVEKDFLIIKSTKDYYEALRLAQEASKTFDIKINLRGYTADKDTMIGLQLTRDLNDSIKNSNEPQYDTTYFPRGRWDDGIYISIEYTKGSDNFLNGYYIVVAGSGPKKDPQVAKTLKKVETKYSDAYIKRSKVYMCCMH